MKSNCFKTSSDTKELAEFLKIISDENRLRILHFLKKDQQCVCDIWGCLGLSQNLVSHHLGILKKSGLVSSEKEGLKVFYSINKEKLEELQSLLDKVFKNGK